MYPLAYFAPILQRLYLDINFIVFIIFRPYNTGKRSSSWLVFPLRALDFNQLIPCLHIAHPLKRPPLGSFSFAKSSIIIGRNYILGVNVLGGNRILIHRDCRHFSDYRLYHDGCKLRRDLLVDCRSSGSRGLLFRYVRQSDFGGIYKIRYLYRRCNTRLVHWRAGERGRKSRKGSEKVR